MPEGDARFAEIIRGHLDVHFVSDADADKILAHFARDVGEDFMAIGQRDTKHRAGQHLGDCAYQLNGLFFSHESDAFFGAQSALIL